MAKHQRTTRASQREKQSWECEFEDSSKFVLSAFRELCKGIATPYAYQALRALDTGSFREFLARSIDPAAYYNPSCFHKDYIVYNYLRKFEGIRPPCDLEIKALDTFQQVEMRNKVVNRKLATGTSLERGVDAVILLAQRKIDEILGQFSFDKVMHGCRWSGGASATLAKRRSNTPNKMLEPLSCTSALLPFAKALVQHDPQWLAAKYGSPYNPLDLDVRIVECEKFDTVPKDWKQRRTIAKQPTMNMFFQKGIGSYIRSRLQRFGVNLNDQTTNQLLARAAVKEGLATLDLSNASDTISRELVRLLLPETWYNWLDVCRCQLIEIDNAIVPLQRFAAMGNGFAFELESLIFYALVFSATQVMGANRATIVSIYGDDIICESKYADFVVDVLEQCGFVINTDKSYTSGVFYESCGKHYFDGIDVTPVYQKKQVTRGDRGVGERLRAANRLLDVSLVLGRYVGFDTTVRPAWDLFAQPYVGRTHAHSVRTSSGIVGVELPWSGPCWGDGAGYFKDPHFIPLANRDGVFYTVNAVTTYRTRRCYGRAGHALYAYNLWKMHTSPMTIGEENNTTAPAADAVTENEPVDIVRMRRWYLQPPAYVRGLSWIRAAFDSPRSFI